MVPQEISRFLSRVLERFLDIQDVWLIAPQTDPEADAKDAAPRWNLLAFADAATLQRLRKASDLHRGDIDLFVVTDGDQFESAWGRARLSGSLVRWAWRRALGGEAFYSEARWAGANGAAEVVRVRRKAVLLRRRHEGRAPQADSRASASP